jgi:hypothetical protein
MSSKTAGSLICNIELTLPFWEVYLGHVQNCGILLHSIIIVRILHGYGHGSSNTAAVMATISC